nr:integrase DNA-binding domain-containing protein [Blautia pseudococcoides]
MANPPRLWYTLYVISGLFQKWKGAFMSEKRRDSKNRVLRNGESQRKDGRYMYKYVDNAGNTKYVYSWRLVKTE